QLAALDRTAHFLHRVAGPRRLRCRGGKGGQRRGQQAIEVLARDRLADRAAYIEVVGARQVLHRLPGALVFAADEYETAGVADAFEMAGELHAVHARHLQVAEDQRDPRVFGKPRHRLLATLAADD